MSKRISYTTNGSPSEWFQLLVAFRQKIFFGKYLPFKNVVTWLFFTLGCHRVAGKIAVTSLELLYHHDCCWSSLMALKHVSIIIDEQVDRRTFWTGGRKKTHGELFMQRCVLLMMTKFQGLNWEATTVLFQIGRARVAWLYFERCRADMTRNSPFVA